MAVFKINKTKDYTVMSNYHLRDKRLTLKAKGLLSQMLSLPEDWDYTLRGLSIINKESIDAIRTAVLELEDAGYITRKRGRDEKGKLGGIEYTIYETPILEKPELDKPTLENPILENPILGNPTLEKPISENPTQLNIDIQTKDLKKYRNQSYQSKEKIDKEQIENDIKQNVKLPDLLKKHSNPSEQDQIQSMVEIIIDIMNMSQDQIRLGNEIYSTKKVKERLLTITDEHIEYILENLQRITHPIKNIRSYLMKSLYTAPLSKNFSDYSKRRNIEDFPSWYHDTKQTEPDEQLINEVEEIQKRLKIEEQESDPKLESEIQHMLQDIEKKGIRV